MFGIKTFYIQRATCGYGIEKLFVYLLNSEL